MDLNEYQRLAMRTAGNIQPAIAGLGLCGEAGEVAELLKKHLGHGYPLGIEALKSELGDVLWYVSVIAQLHGITLEQVAVRNIDKLCSRYPDGFVEGGGNRGEK